MALVGMKIIKNFLPKPLLDACVDDFRSKLNTDCWSSSNFAWKPFLRQGIHGSTIATATVSYTHLTLPTNREV